MGTFCLIDGLHNDLHAGFFDQNAAVQGQVIIGRDTPVAVGVEAVVIAAAGEARG